MNRKVFLCFFASLLLFSCATSYDVKGRFHKVMSGDTIWTIARSYGVPAQEMAELNNVEDPNEIEVGMKLYIPPKRKAAGFKKLPFGKFMQVENKRPDRKEKKKEEEEEEAVGDEKIKVDHGRFEWPVSGAIMSSFGIRGGRRHDGIDIGAKTGTPIKAAGDGVVVFSGSMRGYGNLIILRHKDDFFTVYAHNSKNISNKNDKIKHGKVIAEVGMTGRASGPHLHFEVRHGQKARNPLFFLPRQNGGDVPKMGKK